MPREPLSKTCDRPSPFWCGRHFRPVVPGNFAGHNYSGANRGYGKRTLTCFGISSFSSGFVPEKRVPWVLGQPPFLPLELSGPGRSSDVGFPPGTGVSVEESCMPFYKTNPPKLGIATPTEILSLRVPGGPRSPLRVKGGPLVHKTVAVPVVQLPT